MIFALIATLLVFSAVSFRHFNRDIFSPPVALTLIFSVCALSTLYNFDRWNMGVFSVEAYFLIVWGVAVFVAVSMLVNRQMQRKHPMALEPIQRTECDVAAIDWVKLALVLAAGLIVMAFFYLQVIRIASLGGYTAGDGYAQMMNVFRNRYSYNTLSIEEGLPFLVNQGLKLMTVFAYVYLYLFVNNVVLRGFEWKDLALMLPVALHVLQSLMSAGRLNLIKLVAAALVMAYILWHRRYGWRRMNSARVLLICGGVFVAAMIGFFLLKEMVGRVTDKGLIYYTTVFTGGPIRLFDLYLQNPVAPSGIFGKETFWSLNQFLAKYGIAGEAYIRHLEFRTVNDLNVGNVYTALRRYYQDFGFWGMTLFQALNALLFQSFYVWLQSKRQGRLADAPLLFYGFIAYALFILPIDDQVFSSFINVSYVTLFLALWLAWWFVFLFRWNDVPRLWRAIKAHRGGSPGSL